MLNRFIMAIGALSMTVAFMAFAENLAFIGTTDKNPLLYDCNEKMTFTVTLVDRDANNIPVPGRTLKWARKGDDGKTESGTASSDTPLIVSTSIDRPGFVRLTVNVLGQDGELVKGDSHKFDGGAGANVDQIEGEPLPDGFNEFWDSEVAKLYATPYQVKLTPVDWPTKGIKVVKFEITTYPGEAPATGLIGMPEGAAPKSLDLHVNAIGYGFGRYWVNDNQIRQGKIFVTVARQGEDPIREDEYYTKLKQNELKDFCFRHNDDMHMNDFYKMLIRDLRALQYVKTLPEWNGSKLTVSGGSMGGFQAIGMAALDHDVTGCHAEVTWMCDLAGAAKHNRMGGWRPGSTDVLRFFDSVNLATRVKCPVSMRIGLGDYVCPPSGEMVLFHRLNVPKSLNAMQNRGHGAPFGPNPEEFHFTDRIR